ncbi:MAG TPA: cation diffusion facilitator family transporter [Candidatus Eremiobacteraceae bacterium]|nr:cation diffusion facilitator family transporter [Candidatus Eremiobacteraceae bacterium]
MAAIAPKSDSPGTRNYNEALRRTGDARVRALRMPLLSNALLVVLKLAVWLVSGSVSVLSEALHSAVDLIVTTFQLVGVRMASRPADADHAYGHGKFEIIGAVLEALFILATAAFVVVQAIDRLHFPLVPAHLDLGLSAMLLSALVNLFVSRRLERISKDEQSPALHAEASQLRADVWTAVGVAASLLLIKLTHVTLVDPIVSLMIAGLIVKSAYDVSARALIDLTDGRLPPEQEAIIREIIERHRDIYVGYHKLRTRRSGGGEFIDFHLQMMGGMPLRQAHDASDVIVVDIKKALPRAHVLIHLEPEA